jgi:chemotaxis protein methyltransferase CheR
MSDSLSKDLTLAEFRQFRDFIHLHSGIYLEESKLDSLRISLVARATRLECQGWPAYFERLSGDQGEFRELMNLVTINETSFFRFPAQFQALCDHVVPEIIGAPDREDRVFRVWSAGCSTGEEPYSIAMALADSGLEQLGWRVEVTATDVSTKALGVARAGVYTTRNLGNVPDDVLRRHFVRIDEGSWRVAAHTRGLIEFGYHNLIKEPFSGSVMGTWDVIFCRNVTIYFKLESTRRVVANFFTNLHEGGYLFVGHSETLTSISDEFESVETGGVFLYRRPPRTRRPASGGPALSAASPERGTRGRAAAPPPRAVRARATSASAAARVVQASEGTSAEVTADDLLVRARARMAGGDAAGALEALGAILSVDRGCAEAHLIAARVYADAGDYERAYASAKQALSINPLLAGARYVLGLIYQRQGDVARSIGELKKTIYIDPEFALAHLNLGNIYKTQGKYEQACRQYENALGALRKDPDGSWTQYLGGWQADVVLRTCERSLIECRKALGTA